MVLALSTRAPFETCLLLRAKANSQQGGSSYAGDLPDGQFADPCVQPPFQKKFFFTVDANQIYIRCVPSHTEGRFANVTDVGAGCGGRGGARDGRCQSGRRSRVVLTPRRWCQVGGSNFADDGGKRARSPGSAKKTVKTIARGMPGVSGVTVVTNARVYYPPRAAAGAPNARHSLRPLSFRAKLHAHLGRFASRECGGVPMECCSSPRPACGERSETQR